MLVRALVRSTESRRSSSLLSILQIPLVKLIKQNNILLTMLLHFVVIAQYNERNPYKTAFAGLKTNSEVVYANQQKFIR
jgi:hypothetical protein